MRVYLFETEEVLFTGDGWLIIQDNNPHPPKVYGSHHECKWCVEPTYKNELPEDSHNDAVMIGEYCWEPHENPVCSQCKEIVPDSIQTLIKIHSWER